MNIRHKALLIAGLAAVLVASFFTFGCEEHDVYTVSQEEELERYYTESEICQELFRLHDLTLGATYTLPDNDTIYTDIIENTTRSSETLVDKNQLIELDFGTYYYGEITVVDSITGRTVKQTGQTQTETPFIWKVERRGFFAKLGDNNQEYSGWLLIGFNGGKEVISFDLSNKDGDPIALDYPHDFLSGDYAGEFFEVSQTGIINKGGSIIFNGCQGCVVVANYEATSGYAAVSLTEGTPVGSCLIDTIQTSSTTNRFWNTLFIKTMCMPGDTIVTSWSFVPYKVNL